MSTSSARVDATRTAFAGTGARSRRARQSRRTERRATEDERNARVVELFETSSTPMAAAARAAAAAAALKAMTNVRETSSVRVMGSSVSGGVESAIASAGTSSSASARGVASGSSSAAPSSAVGEGKSGSKSSTETISKPKAETFNPGSNFWTWTPPEAPGADKAPGAPTPKLQKQTETRVSAAVAVAERPLEQSLQLVFQSDMETPSELSLDFESDTEGKSEATAKIETPTVELEETATAVRELGADGAMEGTLENGSRWWRESGEEELEGGKLCRWTLVRGASADGSVEWEEKWWETSDAFNYRELGAMKSGRDAKGNVWQESWREQITHDTTTGFSNASKHIMREANKWGAQADGAEWHEVWDENYWGDGRVHRTCTKKGAIADGSVPDDGHGNRWTHKWGEEWDGHGGCVKWTDSFADRDVSEDGGTGRAWGEKWEERWGAFAHNGSAGNRSGTTWDDRDGHKFEKMWGEEHWHDGRVHKWGSTTDGSDGWDTWEDSQGWWERAPSFGWDEAVSHSPQLLSVPLRPRAPSGSGGYSGKKKTIGRPPGRTIKPPPGSRLHNPGQ
jgi:hypothetical protein